MDDSKNYGLDVIISSPRDQRTLDYLVEVCGITRVKRARVDLPGNTRPYVSNLAKTLGVTIPEEVVITSREDGRRHLANLKSLLKPRPKER